MKTIAFAAIGLSALVLSACAPYGYYDRYGYYHGYRGHYAYSDRYDDPYYRSRDYDDYRYRDRY
jgi:hypothetical protein